MNRTCLHCFAILVAIASIANAGLVSYSVGGWSQQFPGPLVAPPGAPHGENGYPGDTVTFDSYTGTNALNLADGVDTTLKINTLQWTIDFTYGGTPEPWPDMLLAFNAVRSMTIDGVGGSVGQDGLLTVGYENDSLALDAGPMVTFYVQGFRVDVTPLALEPVFGSNFDGSPGWIQPSRNVLARFQVSSVPVPAPAAALLGMIGLGIAAWAKRRGA